MTDIRIGVIGTGMMGCEHIRNVAALDGAVITAVSDPNEEPLRWARATIEHSVGADHEYGEFQDHRDLLRSGEVDAVIVASPNFTHRVLLDDILSTDVPVLVEKPMCTTIPDCNEVVSLAGRRDAITWVGLEYRYMAPVSSLISVVRSGALGDLKMLAIREHRFPFLQKVGNWNRFTRNTGGTLVEKCCHFFDLMNHITESRPVRVMASGGQDVNHLDEVYDGERSDILDNAYVIVEYDTGVRAMLDLSMFAEGGRHEQEIVAVGSKAKAEAFVPGDGVLYVGDRQSRVVSEIACTIDPEVAYAGAHFGASFIEVSRFVDAVRHGGHAEVGVHDGLWSVVLGVAAHRSIDERRVVDIDEFNLH